MTVRMITPRRFEDARGWFSETWHTARYASEGIGAAFCQDNRSYSKPRFTLRGLHFQRVPSAQAKLVQCVRGSVFDVAVDLRRDSPTFAKWVGAELCSERGNQLYIPAGFGHGFLTLEEDCEVAYKVDAYYAPDADGGICWNDPGIGVDWPLGSEQPVLSDKDRSLPTLDEADFDFPYDGNPLSPLENS
jgi:dTDP-4-dehydrorhamnose 3,5-epimerase